MNTNVVILDLPAPEKPVSTTGLLTGYVDSGLYYAASEIPKSPHLALVFAHPDPKCNNLVVIRDGDLHPDESTFTISNTQSIKFQNIKWKLAGSATGTEIAVTFRS